MNAVSEMSLSWISNPSVRPSNSQWISRTERHKFVFGIDAIHSDLWFYCIIKVNYHMEHFLEYDIITEVLACVFNTCIVAPLKLSFMIPAVGFECLSDVFLGKICGISCESDHRKCNVEVTNNSSNQQWSSGHHVTRESKAFSPVPDLNSVPNAWKSNRLITTISHPLLSEVRKKPL